MALNLQAALESLALIEAEYDGISILAATPNELVDDAGNLTDVIEVSYSIAGRPGVFTVDVPYDDNWQAVAFYQVGVQAHDIELIYEGAPDRNQPTTVFLVTPPAESPSPTIPQPGVPVPV